MRLDNGRSAAFARRIGLSKATVHNWLKDGGLPSLDASLRIAAHAGLALPQLLTGDIAGWTVPSQAEQLELALLCACTKGKRSAPRQLDWDDIRAQLRGFMALPVPISVAEAARRLDVDTRHLYLQANREARTLAERWKQYLARRGEEARMRARPYIEAACRSILAEGYAISLREVEERVPREILASVERLFDFLKEIRHDLEVEEGG